MARGLTILLAALAVAGFAAATAAGKVPQGDWPPIDGAGDDILYVSRTQDRKVKRRNCEKVSHESARDAG